MSRKFFNSANLRFALKIVRDPSKTAFDKLSSGDSLGTFANLYALRRYARKVEAKRDRARETRKLKRKNVILCQSK